MSSLPEGFEECVHRYLPVGIHELVFYAPTERALRQGFVYLDAIFAQAPLERPLLILSDVRQSGIPPAMPLMGLANKLRQKYPKRPLTCNAIVYPQGQLSSVFISVMEQLAVLYQARIRFVAD